MHSSFSGSCLIILAIAAGGLISSPADADALALLRQEDEASPKGDEQSVVAPAVTPFEYGRRGTTEWTIEGTAAAEFGVTELAGLRTGVDWFVMDHFSLGLQLDVGGAWVGGAGYTGTLGVATMLRWHFLHDDDWTVFAEVGCGTAWSGAPIPRAGTRFNFTPQAGLGATFKLKERLRLHVGVGWFHLSNARTSSTNPGFDGVAVQVGIGFGF